MSGDAFWCLAPEPTCEELERVVFLSFLRNTFSTQQSSSRMEAVRFSQKRNRLLQEAKKGNAHLGTAEMESKRAEPGASSPLSNIIASLVRAAGVSRKPRVEREAEVTPQTPAQEPLSVTGDVDKSSTIDDAAPQTVDTVQLNANDQPPRSTLAKLIESARLKERSYKMDGAVDKSSVTTLASACTLQNAATSPTSTSASHKTCSYTDIGGEDFGVSLPSFHYSGCNLGTSDTSCGAVEKHPSQMSREEFLRQFKRAPRRGEIGYSAESVAAAEAVGYVMSGSRNKERQHYVDSIQQKLHEKEAQKLRLQFRQVEDERNDEAMVKALFEMIYSEKKM